MTTAQHYQPSSPAGAEHQRQCKMPGTLKLKTLRRSNTFCSRTIDRKESPKRGISDDGEEDESESEDEQLVFPQPNLGTHRNRSQPSLRRVSPEMISSTTSSVSSDADGSLKSVERALPNGDLYIGSFLGNVPHGAGKYLWRDGCMYEGEWKKGKASGIGRFSWPSGATYEGEFKAGRMDGSGIFTGTDGDTYNGMWAADKKHGMGEKLYANGDVYEGEWRNNVQDGEGKYVWGNGNVYVGEWRNGVISGKGVLSWENGNRYEGYWENGVPKGAGVFTRPDGSTYAGNWGNESNHDFAATKPAQAPAPARVSVSERGVNFPRICIWEADEDAGDITCDIIDNVEASKLYREANRESSYELGSIAKSPKYALSRCHSPRQCHTHGMMSPRPYWYGGGGDEIKKPGQPISKGHKNYELMLNFQLGIRHSVGNSALKSRQVKASDFDPREKYWTRFPPEGSKHTPSHQSIDFKWKDYCPMVSRHLREIFGIDPAQYMLAICGRDALREFSSPGKSGSFFYLTQDDRYMIKTVKKAEVKVLIKMLPKYHEHVSKYKNTLVIKFFGVHCVKPVGGQKTRFIVMGNLFHSEFRIHKRFDLKGSSHGRSIDKPEVEIDETTTLKDLDLNFVFRLQHSWFQELMRQVDRDCEFLEAERIMDYSLLIGLHFRDDCSSNERSMPPTSTLQDKISPQGYEIFNSEMQDIDWIMEGKRPFIRLGANMPARAEQLSRIEYDSQSGNGTPPNANGGSEVYDVILYFGIIDILQDYDISKKLEHAYKSLQVDATSISAVDPKLYSKRFRDFMHRVFVEDV